MKAREYSGPLGILAAGALGLSLLCSVSAMAMGDLNRIISITLEPISIVDLAVANFETAAALTEQAVTVFVPTETLVPTSTPSFTPIAPEPTNTERRFVTITPTVPRKTRVPSTATHMVVASRTPTVRPPTRTPVTPTRTPTRQPTLTPTKTIRPTFTKTPPTVYPIKATETPTPPTPYP